MPPQKERLRFLHEIPRWYFLLLLVWAPWCYGSTRPWSADLLGALMALLGLLWLVSTVLKGRLPQVPVVLVACAGILFVQGWWMILNADHQYNHFEFRFEPITPLVSWLPSAADPVQATPTMLRYSGIFCVFLFVADLVQRPLWRSRVWWTLGLTGLSIVAFGIARKIFGINLESTYSSALKGDTSFGTYFYHGNAGAFVNLVIPFIWGLAALSWRRWDANLRKIIWIPALLLSLGAAVVISSKAAMVFTLLLVSGLAFWEFRYLLRRGDLVQRKTLVLYSLLALVGIAIAVGFGWQSAARRWIEIADAPELAQQRLIVYRVCLTILPDSGFWGFGPSNFSIAFPHYTVDLGDKIKGFWMFAHQDYLQTVIEWGWFGAFFWTVILVGALVSGLITLRRTSISSSDQMFVLAALFSLGFVAIHAAVDFPLQMASLQLYAATATGILWGSRTIAGVTRVRRNSGSVEVEATRKTSD